MSWPGDWTPHAEGWGGVHGDCHECGGKLMWTGQGWSAHSLGHHAAERRLLLRAVATLLTRQHSEREMVSEAARTGCVAVKWRCGALRGSGNEWWTLLSIEFWEDQGPFRDAMMGTFRATLAEHVRLEHGIDVNPATFFHKAYE